MWYLGLILIVFIPFKIRIMNVLESNQVSLNVFGLVINVDLETIKSQFVKNKITLSKILSYFSLSNLITDLLKIMKIKEFKLVKYYQEKRFDQTFPIISYFILSTFIESFLKVNHQKYVFDKYLLADEWY